MGQVATAGVVAAGGGWWWNGGCVGWVGEGVSMAGERGGYGGEGGRARVLGARVLFRYSVCTREVGADLQVKMGWEIVCCRRAWVSV